MYSPHNPLKRLSSAGAVTIVLFQGQQMDLYGLFAVSQGFIDGFSLRIAARQSWDLGPEAAFLCLMYQNCIIHSQSPFKSLRKSFYVVAFALAHNTASYDKDLNSILATHTPHQAQS
jgi:hypothetical protein